MLRKMLGRLLAKPIVKSVERGTQWIYDLTTVTPDSGFQLVRGRAGLVPLQQPDGAILAWGYDDSIEDRDQLLLVRLTEDEANRVFSADPYSVGLLEPVRRHMRYQWAFMVVGNEAGKRVTPIWIPRRGSEKIFLGLLDKYSALALSRLGESTEKNASNVFPFPGQDVRGRAGSIAFEYAACFV